MAAPHTRSQQISRRPERRRPGPPVRLATAAIQRPTRPTGPRSSAGRDRRPASSIRSRALPAPRAPANHARPAGPEHAVLTPPTRAAGVHGQPGQPGQPGPRPRAASCGATDPIASDPRTAGGGGR